MALCENSGVENSPVVPNSGVNIDVQSGKPKIQKSLLSFFSTPVSRPNQAELTSGLPFPSAVVTSPLAQESSGRSATSSKFALNVASDATGGVAGYQNDLDEDDDEIVSRTSRIRKRIDYGESDDDPNVVDKKAAESPAIDLATTRRRASQSESKRKADALLLLQKCRKTEQKFRPSYSDGDSDYVDQLSPQDQNKSSSEDELVNENDDSEEGISSKPHSTCRVQTPKSRV